MKRIFTLMAIFGLMSYASAQITTPPSGANQKSVVSQYMGITNVTITYNSPDVTAPNGQSREGNIWGKVVPYGLNNLQFGMSSDENPSPWRAGANENTIIEFSHDMQVEGSTIKAGAYGLHMIPSETTWEVVFSNNSTSWGSYFYKESEDALRVTVTPEKSEFNEWLTYEFDNRQLEGCTAYLKWENLKIPFKISVPNIKEIYAAQIDNELKNAGGFNWQAWNSAASFYLNNEMDLEKALEYANGAVEGPFVGQKNFSTLSVKASVLIAMGNQKEAMKVMSEAAEHPTANVFQIHNLGRGLISQGKMSDALEIFKMNASRFPNTWPINVGLARGYSANGNYKKAMKHAEKALKNAPDERNKKSLTAALEKLKKNEDIN